LNIRKNKTNQYENWVEKDTKKISETFNRLPAAIKERAHIYYSIGRILNYSLHSEDNRIKIQAIVRGTEDYFSEIDMKNSGLSFSCTCHHFLRTGEICKHIGALMIKVLDNKDMIENQQRSVSRLELLKRKHKEFKKKNNAKVFLQNLEKKKTMTLNEMVSKLEPRALVLEITQHESDVQIEIYEQKYGVKGTPIKTSRTELTLDDLTYYTDERFSEFITFVNCKYAGFYIKDFHKFKSVFSGYPYISFSTRKKKVRFGPKLHIQIRIKDGKVKLNFINTDKTLDFDADEVVRQSLFDPLGYLPVYGNDGKTALFVDDIIYPIDSPLSARQIKFLHREKYNLEEVFLNPKELETDLVKKEVIAPLITMGLKFEEKLNVNIPLDMAEPDKKAVWIIEREGNLFTLELRFSYSGIRIKPSDEKNQVVDVKKGTMYVRDFEFEKEQIEILHQNIHSINENTYGYIWELSLEEVLLLIDELFVKYSSSVILDCDRKLTKINHPKTTVNVQVKSGIEWFEMNFKVLADDKEVPFDLFLENLKDDKKFIEIDGEYYRLNQREVNKLKRLSKKIKDFDKSNRQGWHRFDVLDELNDYDNKAFDDKATEVLSMVENFSGIKEYMIPKSLNGTLREYQKNGYNWLRFLEEFRLNGVLADDMGLGKTVQTISLLLSFYERNLSMKGIIVCPKSLLKNWKKEIEKFAPILNSLIYHGTKLERKILREKNPEIWITTYGTFRNDSEFFNDIQFDYCIVDEAQNLKNNQTKTFKEMKNLRANHKIALTGTPIENSINDLKSLFDFLIPGFFGTSREYRRLYENDYHALQKKISPLMLRRKKEDVLKELPPKTIKNFYVEMTEPQENIYISYYNGIKEEINQLTENKKDWNENRFLILKHILRLRQIATHPGMFMKDEEVSSGKLDSLLELLEEITSEGHKALVFSQFSTMLEIVESELLNRGLKSLKITGATRNRETVIDRFKENEEQNILMMTLKVGGVGLNLTEADYVIILDPWWNPAAEMQAIDRTHRIGQERPVMVYRMISSSTIEEKVLELQEKKMDLVKNIVDTNVEVEKDITAEDVREMFR
jgi:SNF2 family DNA or RNA helicase